MFLSINHVACLTAKLESLCCMERKGAVRQIVHNAILLCRTEGRGGADSTQRSLGSGCGAEQNPHPALLREIPRLGIPRHEHPRWQLRL